MNTDLNLTAIIESARSVADKAALSAPDPNADLREAAEQFEAIFLNEFINKAKLAEDIFGSSAQDTYTEMLDRELASNLSGRVNLGIAEALVRQLGQGQQGSGQPGTGQSGTGQLGMGQPGTGKSD
ncbi:MAG: rod-binding protein [Alphaproteobacteria bacterium]